VLGRNRVNQDGFYSRRRGLRSRTRDWAQSHPFIALLIAVVVLGCLTWWEAARIEGARYTVAQGWGTGLAVGILASLGLTALWAAMLLATRGRPRLRARAQWPLAIVLMISWGICLRTTMPASNSPNGGPYVITTGIEVGEIAYAATYSAYFMVLLIWAAVRLRRRAGLSPTAGASPARP
jgi:integral membrane sensor domain MASE1